MKPSIQNICILDLKNFLVGCHLQGLVWALSLLAPCLWENLSSLHGVSPTLRCRWHWWVLLCAHLSMFVHARITHAYAQSPSLTARQICVWALLTFFLLPLDLWHLAPRDISETKSAKHRHLPQECVCHSICGALSVS